MFKRALKDSGYEGLDEYLKGPVGIVFTEEMGQVAKVLKEFKKEHETFDFSLGIIDKVIYNEELVKKIADLPSKEVVLASKMSFFTYKPQNRKLQNIEEAIKELAENLDESKIGNKDLIETLKSVKIVDSTRSLLFTGDNDTFPQVKSLLASIDLPIARPLASIGKTTFFIYKIKVVL